MNSQFLQVIICFRSNKQSPSSQSVNFLTVFIQLFKSGPSCRLEGKNFNANAKNTFYSNTFVLKREFTKVICKNQYMKQFVKNLLKRIVKKTRKKIKHGKIKNKHGTTKHGTFEKNTARGHGTYLIVFFLQHGTERPV